MKLYEFRAKYISLLANYSTSNQREKELTALLINQLYTLNRLKLAHLSHTLYLIKEKESVSEDFKALCKQMLSDIQSLEGE